MADINVGTMTLAQMIARIIEKQDTFEGGAWILSMIDALTAERAHLARLHSNVTTMYLDAQAHIDAAAKRAEANAPKLIEMMEDKDKRIATLTADNAQANQWLVNGVAKIEELERQRDEARAEAERLRPAADLGDAYLASINEDADDNDVAELQDALEAAADRARAAKEAKP